MACLLPIAARGPCLPIAARSPLPCLPIVGRSLGLPIDSRCSGSTADTGDEFQAVPSSCSLASFTEKDSDRGRFLDEYRLGHMLGQGSFGIVYGCSCFFSLRQYAVKMIDKVETPEAEIMHEVDLQMSLNHPNIVKVHEVFLEKCFVCVVMDIFRGGDLIEVFESHWEDEGFIDCRQILHLQKQMVAAIEYLHQGNIVHRDVKGDNYMLDTTNLTDPNCRVALGDFGTALHLAPGGRLDKRVGTHSHWAPEMLDKNYSHKVDIWALGVVVFGMLEGNFPFVGQQDIRHKEVEFSRTLPDECRAFVHQLLRKLEEERPPAAQMAQHAWLLEGHTAAVEGEKDCQIEGQDLKQRSCRTKSLRTRTANFDVLARRHKLVTRMKTAAALREPTSRRHAASSFWDTSFTVERTPASTRRFEWWQIAEAHQAGVLHLEDDARAYTAKGSEASTFKTVERMLLSHGIDTGRFGQGMAKTLADLAAEVRNGASRLMLDATRHKKIVRVVDLVLLSISDAHGHVLVEVGHTLPDGRARSNLNRLPGSKKEPHESTKKAAERIVDRVLQLREEAKLSFDFSNTRVFEKAQESESYPGMQTVYRTEIVRGHLVAEDEQSLSCAGKDSEVVDAQGRHRYFSWLDEVDCKATGVVMTPSAAQEFSSLIEPPVGLDHDALRAVLETGGIDLSLFGQGLAKTLDELAVEIIKGEARLQEQPDGQLLRVVDVILLKLVKVGTDQMLVDVSTTVSNGTVVSRRYLPGGKQRPDENQFIAAQRILMDSVGIDENYVTFDAENVKVIEEELESPSFPGLRTLYRKRVIAADVHMPADEDIADEPTSPFVGHPSPRCGGA